MPKPPYDVSRKTRVPVSTTGNHCPELLSQPRPVGLNKRHEDSLISFLQAHYGWHLGDDGNLYNPEPSRALGGRYAK